LGKFAGRPVASQGGTKMNMQSSETGRGGPLYNLWVQLALLVIATVVLIALAAKYLW
jgi:hypothetical protein